MSEISSNIGLCGEYRLVIRDNNTVVSDTGWCKNTILSGGLEFLSTDSILNGISFLDLGTSSLSGNVYTLPGVVTPSTNKVLLDIPSTNKEYYKLNKNTQVYYAIFSSPLVNFAPEIISEFCIKTINKKGFARAVLTDPVGLRVGQNINFEYRVSVDYTSLQETNVEFTTPDNSSFYIPVTSKTFNVPYEGTDTNRVGRLVDEYILELSQNADSLPAFGEQYPANGQTISYGIASSPTLSRFTPKVVYSDLDTSTKAYTVITEYSNISASNNSGIYDNINSAILKNDTTAFNITRFAFPIAVYNTTLFSTATSINAGNLINLYYSYTWSENITSPFTTPVTFDITSPQLIPCNINAEADLYPGGLLTFTSQNYTAVTSNGNTTRIRVNLKGTTYFRSIRVNYTTSQVSGITLPYGPSPYSLVIYNTANEILKNTGFVFPQEGEKWPYATPYMDSYKQYNNRLYKTVGQIINGILPETTELTNIPSPSGAYLDLIVNTPLDGILWEVVLDARNSVPYDCDEQNAICIDFDDGYYTETITLTGSLVDGIFSGYAIGSGALIDLVWDLQSSEWQLTYDGSTVVTAVSGVSNRCGPSSALFREGDIIISLSSFGSCP